MCKIYATRKSDTMVYIELDDEAADFWGVKKLPIPKFEYAKTFRNMDFLGAVAQWTDADRDETDAMLAVPFTDSHITYSARPY